jgi:succinate dehydrogenase / fumarate reductase cytochrome b subunit
MSPVAFYRSTIGKKIIMGITGLIGVGFVILHMAGNLQAFIGQSKLNDYGAMLHGPLAELTWLLRIVLIVALVLHVTMVVQLTQRSAAARPIGYQKKSPQVATLASRTMKWGGVLLLVFIVVHILHFTTETIDPGGWRGMTDIHGNRDVYGNLIASFRIWWVALFYIVSMIALGLHLYHGAWSSVRTLGYAKPSGNPLHRKIALGVAVILHVVAAVQLSRQSLAARPVGYVKREPQAATIASRTMRWGGVLLLIFIVLHILHFTTGTIRPTGYFSSEDVYANVVGSFRIWWVALFYIVSMIALGLHLFHGAWSSVRTIGVSPRSPHPLHRRISLVIAVFVWAAFTAIPVAVIAGWVR